MSSRYTCDDKIKRSFRDTGIHIECISCLEVIYNHAKVIGTFTEEKENALIAKLKCKEHKCKTGPVVKLLDDLHLSKIKLMEMKREINRIKEKRRQVEEEKNRYFELCDSINITIDNIQKYKKSLGLE